MIAFAAQVLVLRVKRFIVRIGDFVHADVERLADLDGMGRRFVVVAP